MRKRSFSFGYLLFIIFLSYSCSIEKRVYRSGYYIDWHKKGLDSKLKRQDNVESEKDLIGKNETKFANEIESKIIIQDSTQNEKFLSNWNDSHCINQYANIEFNIDSINNETNRQNTAQIQNSCPQTKNTILPWLSTAHAFLAHFGSILVIIGLILFWLALIDLGVIVFVIIGISINLTSTISGLRNLKNEEFEPYYLPLFTKISLYSYGILWLLIFLSIGIAAIFF